MRGGREYKKGLSHDDCVRNRVAARSASNRKKRHALLEKRRATSDGIENVTDFASVLRRFDPVALMQNNGDECVRQLELFAQLQAFQCDFLFEDLLSPSNGIETQVAANYMSTLGTPLIDRIVALSQHELLRPTCLSILCNMTRQRHECKGWVAHMVSNTPFIEMLCVYAANAKETDVDTVEAVLETLGNTCMEAECYRDLVLHQQPSILESATAAYNAFPGNKMRVCAMFFAASLLRYTPFPQPAVIQAYVWPLLRQCIVDASDAESMTLALVSISQLTNVVRQYRMMAIRDTMLLAGLCNLLQSRKSGENIAHYAAVTLSWLMDESEQHQALIEARAFDALLDCVRHSRFGKCIQSSLVGMMRLSVSLACAEQCLSAPETRAAVVHQALHGGSNDVRTCAIEVVAFTVEKLEHSAHCAELLHAWAESNAIEALCQTFHMAQPQLSIFCLRALNALFKHVPGSVEHFESIGGDDAMSVHLETCHDDQLQDLGRLIEHHLDANDYQMNLD